jgi:hypothetical protein
MASNGKISSFFIAYSPIRVISILIIGAKIRKNEELCQLHSEKSQELCNFALKCEGNEDINNPHSSNHDDEFL